MGEDKFYFLGKITRKYSFKGELIIFLDTDKPTDYYQLDKVFIKLNDRYIPYFLTEIHPYKNSSIRVRIEDVNNEDINYWHILSYDNFDEDAWDAQGEEERLKMKKKGLIK